jgi:magnesium-transporting ATPase (P-type)
MSASIATITTSSISPSAGEDLTKITPDDTSLIPSLKDQTQSKIFWTYIITSVIVLIICFYMFQHAQTKGTNSTRPVGSPTWLDSTGVIYTLVILSGVLLGYSTYRSYTVMKASGCGNTNVVNALFALQAMLLITWFYYFYMKPSYKSAYYASLALTAVSAAQTAMLFYKSTDVTASWASAPFLLVSCALAWGSNKVSSGKTLGTKS